MISRRTEGLKMVFDLEVPGSIQTVEVGSHRLGASPISGGGFDLEMFEMILSIMRRLGIDQNFYEYGKKYSASDFFELINRRGGWGSTTEIDGLKIQTGSVPAFRHSYLLIEETTAGASGGWQNWVNPAIERGGFIQGWIFDVEYDYWQNARDPIQYEVAGRSHFDLPKKSNGLPPPLEQLEIDTSKNVCRWELKDGYIEVIGSTMWLGDIFWDRVGRFRKSMVSSSGFIDVEQGRGGVIKISVSDSCFSNDSNEGVQVDLRNVLYAH